jgi:hypothetical protein
MKENNSECRVFLKNTHLKAPDHGFKIKLSKDGSLIRASMEDYEGKAECHDEDTFNVFIGIRLSVSRCMNSFLGDLKSILQKRIKIDTRLLIRAESFQEHLKEYAERLYQKNE